VISITAHQNSHKLHLYKYVNSDLFYSLILT